MNCHASEILVVDFSLVEVTLLLIVYSYKLDRFSTKSPVLVQHAAILVPSIDTNLVSVTSLVQKLSCWKHLISFARN